MSPHPTLSISHPTWPHAHPTTPASVITSSFLSQHGQICTLQIIVSSIISFETISWYKKYSFISANKELGESVGLLACLWSLLTLLEKGASSPLPWLSSLPDWPVDTDKVNAFFFSQLFCLKKEHSPFCLCYFYQPSHVHMVNIKA